MSIQGVGRPRGLGYWKLNVSVLNEELYRVLRGGVHDGDAMFIYKQ